MFTQFKKNKQYKIILAEKFEDSRIIFDSSFCGEKVFVSFGSLSLQSLIHNIEEKVFALQIFRRNLATISLDVILKQILV